MLSVTRNWLCSFPRYFQSVEVSRQRIGYLFESKNTSQEVGYINRRYKMAGSGDVIRAEDYDVVLMDISERDLNMLGKKEKKGNLSVGKFPKKLFPINGVIYGANHRFMVYLPCRELWRSTNESFSRNPTGPIINVWFLIDITSTHSYLTERTMEVIFGTRMDWVAVGIQRQECLVECFSSRGNFKEVNILGTAGLREMGASIEKIDWKQRTFSLTQTLPIWSS